MSLINDILNDKNLLSALTAVELKGLAKDMKVPGWYNLKKDDLVKALFIPLPEKKNTKVIKTDKHSEIEKDVQEFIKNGNEIKVCKPGKTWKIDPPTQKSALKSTVKKTTKKSQDKKAKVDKVSTPKRNNPDIITLKQICDDMGVSSYKVRKYFRAEKISKPGKQWAWEISQAKAINEIKELIKGIK